LFNIYSKESFNNINTWLKELKTFSNPDAKIFLIGNKTDLEYNRKVTKEEAQQYKSDMSLNYFTECSAKSGFNSQEVFIEAAKELYKDFRLYNKNRTESYNSQSSKSKSIKVGNVKIREEVINKKSSCC